MWRLVTVLCVLTPLAASPASVSAQAGEETETSEPTAQEPVSESVAEEPALQLQLDEAGVGVAPSPRLTPKGYTLEEAELRVKRARIGLIVSAASVAVGVAFFAAGSAGGCSGVGGLPAWCDPLLYTGGTLLGGGLYGMIPTGILLAKRKRDRDVLAPPRTRKAYTLEQAELRVKRARIGLIVSASGYVVGFAFLVAGLSCEFGTAFEPVGDYPAWCDPLLYTGSALLGGGLFGMIASGVLLARRKRDRNISTHADYGTPRRAQWDLARSRLVF